MKKEKKMKTRFLKVLLALTICLSANSQELDQQSSPPTSAGWLVDNGVYTSLAQSFTAGIDADLHSIEFWLNADNPVHPLQSGTFSMEVRAGNGYGGTLLSTETFSITGSESTGMYNIPVTSSTVSLINGNQYTFIFRETSGTGKIMIDSNSGTYAGGTFYSQTGTNPPTSWSNYDMIFNTYVTSGGCSITDQTVSAATSSFCINGSTDINLSSSEIGVNYYLRDNTDNSIVDGPFVGTGEGISFNTGSIDETMTYNVYAQSPSGALQFDGINDYVRTSNSVTHDESFTYEAWVKLNSPSPAWKGIITTTTTTTYGSPAFAQLSLSETGTLRAEVHNGTSTWNTFSAGDGETIVNDNTWHHVAFTYDGSSANLYVDGELDASFSVTGMSPFTLTRDIVVMSERAINSTSFNRGTVDEVRVWNIARTQTEIQDNMNNCLSGSEADLILYYQFEDGAPSSIVTDISSSNNDGNLINMDSNDDWVNGSSVCECTSEMTTIITINVSTIEDQTVNASEASICDNGSTTINLSSSETGVNYYLRDDADNSVIDGPSTGDGSTISLSTGTIDATTTYNVFAEKIDSLYAVDLPSNNDRIQYDTPFSSYTDEITIEAWVRNPSLPFRNGQSSANSDNMSTNVWLWESSFFVNDNGTWRALAFPEIPPSTEWLHVATVANSSGLFIYYNGELVASNESGIENNIRNNSSSIISLGQDPRYLNEVGRNSNHGFDDFRVWNVARSDEEIAANYQNCLDGTETDLVLYTKFNEGNGADINSSTGVSCELINPSTNWITGSGNCTDICTFELTNKPTVTVLSTPTADVLGSLTECESYELPSLTAGNYYTETNGGGTMLEAGNVITSSQTIYIYAENGACSDESSFEVSIKPNPNTSITQTDETLTVDEENASYQWIDCDNDNAPIGGETSQSFTVTENGSYAVEVTLDGCEVTSDCIVIDYLSINKNTLPAITVYPNPNRGQFTVDFGGLSNVNLTVRDVTGKVVYHASNIMANSHNVTLENSKGVYLVEINSESTNQVVRVVKQ